MQNHGKDYAIDIEPMPDGVVVAVAGELDVANARALRDDLWEGVLEFPPSVRIDLSNVSFLDSTIVGLLVSIKRNVNSYGGRFSVQCGPRSLLALGIRGLLDYLNVDSAGSGAPSGGSVADEASRSSGPPNANTRSGDCTAS